MFGLDLPVPNNLIVEIVTKILEFNARTIKYMGKVCMSLKHSKQAHLQNSQSISWSPVRVAIMSKLLLLMKISKFMLSFNVLSDLLWGLAI